MYPLTVDREAVVASRKVIIIHIDERNMLFGDLYVDFNLYINHAYCHFSITVFD